MNRKLVLLIGVLVVSFTLFLIFYNYPKSYSKTYELKDFKIAESYNTEKEYYEFQITYNDINFPYIINHKYMTKRNFINDIDIEETKENTCIYPKSSIFTFAPLCYENNQLKSFNIVNNDLDYEYKKSKNLNIKFNDLLISDFYDKTFLINNYYGFYWLNDSKKENIKLFKNDTYDMNLIYQIDKYLLIRDYDSKYYFNKFYLINTLNGKVKKIEFDNNISDNSIFLGDYKDKVYLLDKKEKKEYEINIKKLELKEIEGTIFNGEKLIKTKISKIINENLMFTKTKRYSYKIEDQKLYQIINNEKILISKNNVSKIIKIDDDSVYYLVLDKLYVYNPLDGERLLINNFEWNFNNNNAIFIF